MESRRRFLTWVAFSLFGAITLSGVLAGADILSKISGIPTSLLRVKVVYNIMARYVSQTEEYFVLKSPASLRDLMKEIAAKHQSLSSMVGDQPTMMFLVNGRPSQPSTTLKDGNQVDLIPIFDGG